jgi:hypothetical protein
MQVAMEATYKPTNMKKTLLFVLALFHGLLGMAQKGVYEDLLVLYVDEKYEKCIFKAEGYTEAESTKKDALPYLYISMCYFEMSKQEKFNVDYPKASRDAIKWAEKYRKKDKDLEFFNNYGDFWAELNTMVQEQGENFLEDPKGMSKAKQMFDGITSYYPENPGGWLMLAVCNYKANMAKEGDMALAQFDKAMTAAGDIGSLPTDQKKLLKNALIRYADLMVSKGQTSKAKQYAGLGKDHFMGEADFKGMWESL